MKEKKIDNQTKYSKKNRSRIVNKIKFQKVKIKKHMVFGFFIFEN